MQLYVENRVDFAMFGATLRAKIRATHHRSSPATSAIGQDDRPLNSQLNAQLPKYSERANRQRCQQQKIDCERVYGCAARSLAVVDLLRMAAGNL